MLSLMISYKNEINLFKEFNQRHVVAIESSCCRHTEAIRLLYYLHIVAIAFTLNSYTVGILLTNHSYTIAMLLTVNRHIVNIQLTYNPNMVDILFLCYWYIIAKSVLCCNYFQATKWLRDSFTISIFRNSLLKRTR
jgi:hypothetical protein